MSLTFFIGKWLVRWSAIVTGLPSRSVPGLQLYSTWHCEHISLESERDSSAILRV